MKQLLEHIQTDWDLLKDKHEREIIESYAEDGRLVTIIMICKKNSVICLSCITFCKIINYYSFSSTKSVCSYFTRNSYFINKINVLH